MIKSAISSTVYFRLITTTSIIARLAVCAILLASISSAHAARNANDEAGATDAARRPAAHVMLKKPQAENSAAKNPAAKNLAVTARKLPTGKTAQPKTAQSETHQAKSAHSGKDSQSKLARLEREWKQLHSRRQAGLLGRLVACRELGRCDGLKIHPTRGAALISVSPERPGLGAAVAGPEKETTAAARGVYAAAKAKKPVVSAKLRSKQPARIRSAAAETDGSDMNAAGLLYGGALPVNP